VSSSSCVRALSLLAAAFVVAFCFSASSCRCFSVADGPVDLSPPSGACAFSFSAVSFLAGFRFSASSILALSSAFLFLASAFLLRSASFSFSIASRARISSSSLDDCSSVGGLSVLSVFV